MFSGKGRDSSFYSSEVSSGTTNTGITKVEIFLPNFKASEFKFWNNLKLSNSRAIVSHLPQLAIQTDASKNGRSHIRSKNGRHQQPGTNNCCKINLILFAVENNYNYSRLFAEVSQHKADHVLRHFQDRNEWLLCKNCFQKICQEWGQSNIDLFTTSIFHQVPEYIMETRSAKQCNRCISAKVVTPVSFCISRFCS